MNRSKAKRSIKDIEGAICDLDKAISIDSQNADAFFNLVMNKGMIVKVEAA